MRGHGFYLSILLADDEILVQLECPFFFRSCKSIQYWILHNGKIHHGLRAWLAHSTVL